MTLKTLVPSHYLKHEELPHQIRKPKFGHIVVPIDLQILSFRNFFVSYIKTKSNANKLVKLYKLIMLINLKNPNNTI